MSLSASPPALRLEGIRKSFGPTVALDGVHLEVRPGEVHALIGENGAGKSTLMNIVAGAIRPDAGRMELFGRPYAPANTLEARRSSVALIHQELSLCPHLSVTENILLGRESARLGGLEQPEPIGRDAGEGVRARGHGGAPPASSRSRTCAGARRAPRGSASIAGSPC